MNGFGQTECRCLDFDSLRHLHLLYDMRPLADIWLDFIYDNSLLRARSGGHLDIHIHIYTGTATSRFTQQFVSILSFYLAILLTQSCRRLQRIEFVPHFFFRAGNESRMYSFSISLLPFRGSLGVNAVRRHRNRGKFDILNAQDGRGWALE